jgi:hypothetical protein
MATTLKIIGVMLFAAGGIHIAFAVFGVYVEKGPAGLQEAFKSWHWIALTLTPGPILFLLGHLAAKRRQ